MKLHIGCVVFGFFSLLLSLAPRTFAQAATHVTISGAAFVCTNQGGCPNAEFDPALGSMLNPQGTWVANVSLPQGAVVSALRLCGNFNEVGSSITATLYHTPVTASSGFATAVAMANVQSTGAADLTQCFKTATIKHATINNNGNQYYVVVVVPDNDGVNFSSVQIEY